MSYITFKKEQLVNLSYSLNIETLRASRTGSYSNTSILSCNTVKHHGLLVTPQPKIDNDLHVLLSSFDETLIQHEQSFNLAVHKYPGGIFYPGGHKYVIDFDIEPNPYITYQVGGAFLKKEPIFSQQGDCVMIRYTLICANSETRLQFRPFLAFRNIFSLSKANNHINKKYSPVANGISLQPYENYPSIFLQFSKPAEYVHVPDWFYNIEYFKDQDKGMPYQEDLFVPGYFEIPIKKGESIIFSAGLTELSPSQLKNNFSRTLKKRIPSDSFKNCLNNSASQFVIKRDNNIRLEKGYPPIFNNGIEQYIAAPGVFLSRNLPKEFEGFLAFNIKNCSQIQKLITPNAIHQKENINIGLWFIWCIQQYALRYPDNAYIYKKYGKQIKSIVSNLIENKFSICHMDKEGLLDISDNDSATTWMNAELYGKAVTPRNGKAVEVNALWYNALCFSKELCNELDNRFVENINPLIDSFPNAFVSTFWLEKEGFLADYVAGEYKNDYIRPNMIFAVSLPFSPLDTEKSIAILKKIQADLLTPKGLRTLSPRNLLYKGDIDGSMEQRRANYHLGAVYPWLFTHFAEGYLKFFGNEGLPLIKNTIQSLELEMSNNGIGTFSEVYCGNPPYFGKGVISYAPNVGEILRLLELIRNSQTQ